MSIDFIIAGSLKNGSSGECVSTDDFAGFMIALKDLFLLLSLTPLSLSLSLSLPPSLCLPLSLSLSSPLRLEWRGQREGDRNKFKVRRDRKDPSYLSLP